MEECIFCKISSGKVPSARVYEDDAVFAFLDISPATKGHTLIIPKTHAGNVEEANPQMLANMIVAAKKVGEALKGMGASGFNLLLNNGKDAGQVVMHAHLHVIPRYPKDHLKIEWEGVKHHATYAEGEMESVRKRIVEFF